MVLYPDVMRQAQAQIDQVVGRSRLPSFSDRDCLPYIDALVKEVHRWKTVGPLGVPRYTSQRGGQWIFTISFISIGRLLQRVFDSEKVCVGRDLANQALFMDIATILWAFDIKKATDVTGQPITPSDGYILDGGVFM
ncbi:hypothetical protein EIP86_001501 [Pleurotus ostreatoroseus]|nr:hypothetical protein EIP86_001501 [Pleurotus ostreatoroseus]